MLVVKQRPLFRLRRIRGQLELTAFAVWRKEHRAKGKAITIERVYTVQSTMVLMRSPMRKAFSVDSRIHGRFWRRSRPPWSQAQRISRLHPSDDRTGLRVSHCRLEKCHFWIPRLLDMSLHQFRKSPNKRELWRPFYCTE